MRPFNVEIVSYAASQENWQLDKKEKGWTKGDGKGRQTEEAQM